MSSRGYSGSAEGFATCAGTAKDATAGTEATAVAAQHWPTHEHWLELFFVGAESCDW
ncbi:MAG: hypothetical protein ABI625_11920 [bacterium]